MKSVLFRTILLVLIVFAVGGLSTAIPVVSAQGSCQLQGLAAADCKLIADAGDNLSGMKTFVIHYTTTFRAGGLPDGTINLYSQGSAPVDLSNVDGSDLPSMVSKVSFSATANSSLTVGNITQSGPINVRMYGGTVYVNASKLTQNQWESFSLSKVFDAFISRSGVTLSPQDVNFDGLGRLQKNGFASLPGIYKARSQPGPVVDGQPTTQISVDVNVYSFFAYLVAPEHRDQFKAMAQASGRPVTDSQIAQFAVALPLLKSTLQTTKFQQTWIIGSKDRLYHGWGLTFSATVDQALVTLLSPLGSRLPTQNVNISATVQVLLTKIGTPVTVQEVGSAKDITNQILQALSNLPANRNNPPVPIRPASQQPVFIPKEANTRYKDLLSGTSPDGFATLGSPDAPVKMMQLSSYSCAACQQYYTTKIVPILDEIQKGRVYYTFVPVSLTGEFDPSPETAAAYCALQQNTFWQMHDVLFDWQVRYGRDAADPTRLVAGAEALGMDSQAFSTCLNGPDAARFVQAANDRFDSLDLHATPTLLINGKLFHPSPSGTTEPDLHAVIDQLVNGGELPTPVPLPIGPPPRPT